MDRPFVLRVDPELSYSINIQIKEQLKWFIGTGKMKPGDMLPSAGELAETLHVNRNTINSVYTQLRDEGIVSVQKGKGTQIIDSAQTAELIESRKSMYELWTRMIQEAAERKMDLDDFAVAGMAYVQLLGHVQDDKPTLLFIECREHDYPFYRNEIIRLTGATVNCFYLEDLTKASSILEELIHQADTVLTTLNHAEEVRGLVGARKQVITLGATVDFGVLMDVAKRSKGSQVGFVCLGLKGGQWMAQKAADAGIEHIVSVPLGMNDEVKLRELIKQADKLYASSAVYDELKHLAPDKVAAYPLVLEKSSEELLKNLR
ncbi:GntR family transcriptional regulator [Paenibacillus sp. UNC451MF]|uniref:GntR family transcriptional regulator n=1 Tax=Paenibacillus sp. UNC451MF TaxID=1449063 RepID=UPI00048B41AB|nr:GntR family transcriptional regulator [Paenibacillus sp. UNC451MF]